MNDASFTFERLTPNLLINALESVGVYPESGLLALNSYENRVYQFQTDSKQRYVVKYYRPERWSNDQILEEHSFLFAMQQAEIPVAAPILIQDQSLFEYENYRFALFPSVGGRGFEVDNLKQLEMVSRYLGRIHQLGAKHTFIHRPTISLDDYLYTPRKILQASQFVPLHIESAFFSSLDLLIEKIEKNWRSDWHNIALHGDCHAGNILWQETPIFVDLDDARNGPAIQDIWMLLNGDNNERRMQLDIIAEAYNEFNHFPYTQLQLIEPLRGLRIVHYMAWLTSRWQDPAFPHAFPWFAENKYWENQVLVLKEQIAALDEPPLTLPNHWQ